MDDLLVDRIVRAKYTEYARKVIWHFKRYGKDAMQSGADSPYKNVWQEYAAQVQGEESLFYALYEHELQCLCLYVLQKLNLSELQLLWLRSHAYEDMDVDEEAHSFPADNQLLDDVVDELYSHVQSMAGDEDVDTDTTADDF